MKITDVKTFLVDCFRTNWAFVKVYTEMLTPSLIQMHPTCTQTAP